MNWQRHNLSNKDIFIFIDILMFFNKVKINIFEQIFWTITYKNLILSQLKVTGTVFFPRILFFSAES